MSNLAAVIGKGLLPSQLPPCFGSTSMASKVLAITRRLKKKNPSGLSGQICMHVRPETFSVARIGHTRRITSIVNPITYFYLSRAITTNWSKIDNHYKKSRLSLSKPTLNHQGNRSISFTQFKDLQETKILESAGYKYVLITDISQYFPSIYTHTIGWALDGKDLAKKKQYKKNLHKNDLGVKLDRLVGFCQSNQTIGLPIGPDASHIISEIIGTAIDYEFLHKIGFKPHGFRFVDDFYLYFETLEMAEEALAKLSNVIANYELKINSIKTKILPLDDLYEDTWKYPLQQFKFENEQNKQKYCLNHYFEIAFNEAKKYADDNANVMAYAIKRLRSIIVKRQNWEIFESYLCRVMMRYPNTLQDIAQMVMTYYEYNYITDFSKIQRTLNQIIKDHAGFDHHSETAWALWMCLKLKVKVDEKACKTIADSKSSIIILLAYELQTKGLLEINLEIENYASLVEVKELWRTNWLLSYEAGRREWLGAKKAKLKEDKFYGILDDLEVSFFDPEVNLDLLFKPVNFMTKSQLNFLFDSDQDINDEFEFMREEGDYSNEVVFKDLTKSLGDEEFENPSFSDFEDDIPF